MTENNSLTYGAITRRKFAADVVCKSRGREN